MGIGAGCLKEFCNGSRIWRLSMGALAMLKGF